MTDPDDLTDRDVFAAIEARHRELVAALDGVRLETAPEALEVRCGIGRRGKKCGALIGHVVAAPAGLAWVPAVPGVVVDGFDLPAPGGAPLLLPDEHEDGDDEDEGAIDCRMLGATCKRGRHTWSLTSDELRRRAKSPDRTYTVTRVVPDEWGPHVNDPSHWTDEELLGAIGALFCLDAKVWPPPGMSGAQASRATARANVLIDVLDQRGSYADRHDLLLDRLEALRRCGSPGEHNAPD